ncbi:MAG: acetyltransferase [Bacteroidales bacterium]|jgi:sugar O-acyltransferase (sialic acid O-acetyltransferase NeuD family)|nr:acetyltransferase [Bacteroidales bacterium]
MIKPKKLLVVGLGEFARVIAAHIEEQSSYTLSAFVANLEYKQVKFYNKPVVSIDKVVALYPPKKHVAFVAISYQQLNQARTATCKQMKDLGYKLVSIIGRNIYISPEASYGENCLIAELSTIEPFVRIGNNVFLTGANYVGHGTIIRDNCFIAAHTCILGKCDIGENCFIGANATIAGNIKIAKNNFVGMGATVSRNTIENKIYVGNPAKESLVSAKRLCSIQNML